MPFPLPRRSLLASAAGAALLVGCSAGPEETEESAGGTPSATERARARGAQESNGLLVRYDAVLAVHPALSGLLGPLRAEVVRHVEAFGGREKTAPSPTASSPTASAPVSSSPTSTAPAAPVTEKDALVGLAGAERALADRRAAELVDVPGELARLLASVAAAGAAHAYLLTEGTR
ncbi:hypothetical protein [Streptomyces sp. NPDC020951]|uniref:hypothetical protein n=1 Tax=Streptomyces sp. NPDC020951 TaxID=3365104 RepID=UPI0037B13E91